MISAGKADDDELQFRFVAVEGAGHYGYIEFVANKMVVVPKGEDVKPDDKTKLLVRSVDVTGYTEKTDKFRNIVITLRYAFPQEYLMYIINSCYRIQCNSSSNRSV